MERGGLSRGRFLRRTLRVRGLYGGCGIPFMVGSGIRVTGGVSTSNIRINRDSVRTNGIHGVLNSSGVVNISTRAIRRTLLTRGRKTSCLKIKTIFGANSGSSTSSISRSRLRGVYRTISVPMVTVNKVDSGGIARLGNENVMNVTIVDTVFTRPSVAGTATRLGTLARGAITGSWVYGV